MNCADLPVVGDPYSRPEPFSVYTSPLLWNDPHISVRMLEAHLDPSHDRASAPECRIDECVAWLVSRVGIGLGTRICDFGCGPGLWTTLLARAGATVTGLDISKRSIRYAEDTARATGLDIRYVLCDYLDFTTTERFDLVTVIHGDFSVLSPGQRSAMLATFRDLLTAGGHVALDVSSIARFRSFEATPGAHEFLPDGGFFSASPHHLYTSSHRYEEQALLAHRYLVVEPSRWLEIVVWDQCYSVATLTSLFDEHGLVITDVYADLSGAPLTEDSGRIAVVARKLSDAGA
jgi:cyclopropane fatty-acyl-phospholipid synthase-like methyltransferase